MKQVSSPLAHWAALGLSLLMCLAPVQAAGVQYAMKMEYADRSLLLDVAAAGELLVAVGERGHILYSEDQGENWTQAEVPTRAMLTRVFFIDDKTGWAVGHDGNVLLSRDGGVNWELQRDGLASQVQVNEERAGRAAQKLEQLREQLAAVSEEDKNQLMSALEDAQSALDTARDILNEPVYAPPLMDIWFATPEQGWASGAYGTLLHTGNGGHDWSDWSYKVDNPEELHLNGVIGDSSGALYLASEWGTVFHSDSRGETWSTLETGYDGSFFGVVVNPASETVFAYGLRGNIYRSLDQGENWEAVNSGVQASLLGAMATHSGSLLLVGQGGTATRSDDDGDSFQVMIQPVRKGIHGIAPLADGRFIGAGEGGSRVLVDPRAPQSAGGQVDE